MKRLLIITLAALVLVLTLGFDTSTLGKDLTGGGRYAFWDNQGGYLYIDSTATRDTAYFWGFYGCDSIRIFYKADGASGSDNDTLFLMQYTMDWYGTMTLVDTIIKGASANAGGLVTVYSAQSRLSPGIALVLKAVGTTDKPDTVQVIVSPVNTY